MNNSKAQEFVDKLGECMDGIGGISAPVGSKNETSQEDSRRFKVSFSTTEDEDAEMTVRGKSPAEAVEAVKAARPGAVIKGVD